MDIELTTLFAAWDRIALRWSLSEPAAGPVTFEVWRSGNAVTGYELITTTPSLAHIDRLVRGSKFEPAFYRIEAVIGDARVRSNVAGLEAEPDVHVLALQKRERFKLAKDGIETLLFTRRRSGPRCPRCVIPVQGATAPQCDICYGSGFAGGYYPPLPIYIAPDTLKVEGTQLRQEYVSEASNANLWTSNWTLIDPEDVLIELRPPNHIWYVTSVQRTQRRRKAVRQLLTVNEADPGGPLSRLPVPDLRFPRREELWFFAPVDGRDFDVVFQEFLDHALRANPIPGHEDEPTLEPPGHRYETGERDPETGLYR